LQLPISEKITAIEKIDGVNYRRVGCGYFFFGIDWNEAPQQQDFLNNLILWNV